MKRHTLTVLKVLVTAFVLFFSFKVYNSLRLYKNPHQSVIDTTGTNNLKSTSETSSENVSGAASTNLMKGQVNLLLLGTDKRPADNSLGNSDTIIVAHVDPNQNRVALLSIPRDTQIAIPKYGNQKINAVARLENGQVSTINAVEKIIGQKIDGFVQVDFAGFKEIIDTLGGITVNVEKNMYYVTGDKQDGVINLKKGMQRLNGAQVLQYVRFRHDQFADISRSLRQQNVIKDIAQELAQTKTIPKLPWLIPEAYRTIRTDLGINNLWSFTDLLLHWNQVDIVSQTLPGYFDDEKKTNYWKVNSLQAQKVTSQLFEQGKTTDVFVNPPITAIHKPERTNPGGKDKANSPEVSNGWALINKE